MANIIDLSYDRPQGMKTRKTIAFMRRLGPLVKIASIPVFAVCAALSLLVMLGAALYFTPTIIARNRPNGEQIFIVNLLLGWTLIGWVIALAWAAAGRRQWLGSSLLKTTQ